MTAQIEPRRPGFLFNAFAHAIACVVVVAVSVALSVIAYFACLALALVTNSGIGGPLALPFMMLVAFVASVMSVLFVCLPITLTVAIVRRRLFGWPRIAEIPLAAMTCLAGSVLVAVLIAAAQSAELGTGAQVGLVVGTLLIAPLGIYWLTIQVLVGVRFVSFTLWNRYRARRSTRANPVRST